MAEIVVGRIVLQKLVSLLSKEAELLGGVDTAVEYMRVELGVIKSTLREMDGKEVREGMRTWATEVREIAYDIEDVLDEYMFIFGKAHRHGFSGFLRESTHSIRNLGARHRITTEFQRIKRQVQGISEIIKRYDAGLMDEGTSSNAARNRLHGRPVAAVFVEEDELVGIDKPRYEIIARLLYGGPQLKVIPVVGMAGLGKTTLVRKVYDNEKVKGWFTCRAWITVTQLFIVDHLLKSIITQFFGNQPVPEEIKIIDDRTELIGVLRHYLNEKRYVIVFDDLCDIHAWNSLQQALPANHCGSRILVTTRTGEVGLSCLQSSSGGVNDDHVYYLQPLSPKDSWSLFCKKAFRPMVCPSELKDLSEDIVKICDRLPLAIVTIGGLLFTKRKTVLEWMALLNNLQSELANNPNLENIKKILLLSYSDLPDFLKPCFLYFSIFPRDHPVKRITLVRLWIAEGFIDRDRGETMEDVAENYLNDLIDRNMVQVSEFYDYGRVRSCRVHDLTREIIVMKSKEENFSTSLIRQNTQLDRKIRRVSIHDTSGDLLRNISFSRLRALFIFGPNALPIPSHIFSSSFRFLKVLDLEGATISRFPIKFKNVPHLRYLSLRDTRINKLSGSLGKLKNLETLDLKGTRISALPTGILKLRNLRHLLAYQAPFYYTFGVKVPQGIGSLNGLQKLSYVEADQDSNIIGELGKLTQLKRLGIVKLKTEDGANVCASIQKLTNLHSFSLTSVGFDQSLDLQSLSSPPPLLQRLYLRGPLQPLPHWVASLRNLVRMRLRWSRLSQDSIEVLQALPNLVELTLIWAYEGTELRCESGGFQSLKILDLEQLNRLKHVIVNGAMPNLQKMSIRSCWELQVVPLGIQGLKKLKELHLFDMADVFLQRLRRHEGIKKIKHIPVVRCYDTLGRLNEEL